ncbi:MAG: hypothetical protein M0C28_38690 [Candidatus Moduliflexus flocculans]|nr:hypothetical protein [Candidatus Moduliflexus flocculans]
MSVVAFFVLALTAVPWLVLVVFKLIFAGNLKFLAEYPWLPLSILGYSRAPDRLLRFLLPAPARPRAATRATSPSSSSRPIIFSDVLSGILTGIFRTPYMGLFSLRANLQQAGAFLFGAKPPLAVPAGWSFAVLAGDLRPGAGRPRPEDPRRRGDQVTAVIAADAACPSGTATSSA